MRTPTWGFAFCVALEKKSVPEKHWICRGSRRRYGRARDDENEGAERCQICFFCFHGVLKSEGRNGPICHSLGDIYSLIFRVEGGP